MDYTGTLLIASPHLQDQNFRMAVVLITHQTDRDVVGLILNQASSRTVGDFWKTVFNAPCHCDEPLYIGGPLVGPLMGLHEKADFGGIEPSKDVYLAVEKDRIGELAESGTSPCRVFLGFSGWSVEQLANEIQEGFWYLLPADEEDLFAEPSELWLRSLQKSTGNSLRHLVRMPVLPENPSLN